VFHTTPISSALLALAVLASAQHRPDSSTAPVVLEVAEVTTTQDMNAAVDRATAAYSNVRTMSGKLEQNVRNLLTGSQHITRADFQQTLPDRISVRFTEPAGDMLIADGTAVWIFTPSATPGVVTRAPMNAASVWINMVSWLVQNPRERFTLTDQGAEALDGRAVRVVSFVPKEPMPELRKATAWIDVQSGVIRQVEVNEPSLVRRIRFTTLNLNPTVNTSLYNFTVPRGVRIETVGG